MLACLADPRIGIAKDGHPPSLAFDGALLGIPEPDLCNMEA